MNNKLMFFGNILRWILLILGAISFVYGIGYGRWDAAVVGLFLMQFGIAVSLKLRIMELREKIKNKQ